MSIGSDDLYIRRQSTLLRELEELLDLNPRELSSNLLSLPKEVRDLIWNYVIPDITSDDRPELHTNLWSAEMIHEPWRHDIFGYGHQVPKAHKLHPNLLLINKQLHNELLQCYFRRSKLTLHAELRNSRGNNWHFDYSPHILQIHMLKFVTHVRLYVEWNYTIFSKNDRIEDQVRMTKDLTKAIDTLVSPLHAVEHIELSVLFFWKFRTGKFYALSMQDLFDSEDVFKRHAESRWLRILRTNKSTVMSPNPSAGVGYKLSSEDKGTEQSGGMEIFVSQDLEDAMQSRRKSNIDFYGNYGISDPLPHPGYELGTQGMI
ncbi:hypothetical protein P280DRAFT_489911 [Massarina eburnea CBS 473.64]|uniref:F-box domain-containing protein n=1 Tax=Massarina eburnea CBS 473.64 TaxID=1395130 RepID=A0A6A6S4F6_9PLEO|nr:hypothetical protein P280DRAFT_489911 [Massarina eburnea CBS 473.64]